MLRIYSVMLEMLRDVRLLIPGVQQHDADLARQLRRAASSVVLNCAEGMYSQGRNQKARFHTSMGSAREVLACFEVAEALGYIDPVGEAFVARMNRIIGTLHRLVRP